MKTLPKASNRKLRLIINLNEEEESFTVESPDGDIPAEFLLRVLEQISSCLSNELVIPVQIPYKDLN